MNRAQRLRQGLSLPKHTKFAVEHTARLLFAIIILGFHVDIIRFRADDILVYSIVLVTFTILTCTYYIVRLCASTATHNIKISLAIHLFMSLFWLADTGLVVMLVMDWEELDPTAHLKTFVARIVLGAFECLLWLMPIADLALAVVDKRKNMSTDEHIQLPRRYATASRPTPTTPTQRAEPWDDMVSPPPQRIFQPLLPEN
ncbi:hypothetical protein GT037_004355 [Alternaria burnsii]|uniref:MARVEL domain-containing protein n=1 Tax=Alternaria burnsii TaxID=1187904 RepID=A0A8H7B4T2_9PLEO|nr:uncharacterized protein GT037_004355 [Alternaria burnsii]KAF7677496.1 hypothetical protein GT037_004355 [Alternaria burnsii]CAI9627335.1 unnamed protein product [Alternaria burnsii]